MKKKFIKFSLPEVKAVFISDTWGREGAFLPGNTADQTSLQQWVEALMSAFTWDCLPQGRNTQYGGGALSVLAGNSQKSLGQNFSV